MVGLVLINEQSNINLIFVSLPFEFFQKRGPHKVGDANKFIPRFALNFEEHGVRYAGLDRSAVSGRKYFTAPALSKGIGLRFQHSGLLYDFITTGTAGFIGHQIPVRRDAALPGSGLSKKWPHRTKRPKRMGGDKKTPPVRGASGDANEPSGEGRTLGNLRATLIPSTSAPPAALRSDAPLVNGNGLGSLAYETNKLWRS
jgi:hypothetical protein